MLPDRVSNPGPLTYESGALPIALRGPAIAAPMARSQPLLSARNRYGPRETFKHKMDAVNLLRGFTDCLTFPFSKIYKDTFYHYAAKTHIYQ